MKDMIQVRFFLVGVDSECVPMIERSLRQSYDACEIVALPVDHELVESRLTNERDRGRGGRSPSVILLYIKEVAEDGLHVLDRLKSTDSTRYIPIIVLANSMNEDRARKCYDLGCNLFISLPSYPLELDEPLRRLCDFLKVILLPYPS